MSENINRSKVYKDGCACEYCGAMSNMLNHVIDCCKEEEQKTSQLKVKTEKLQSRLDSIGDEARRIKAIWDDGEHFGLASEFVYKLADMGGGENDSL